MKTHDIHTEIEEWMAGALLGGLSVEEEELFDRHLAQCETCRALYREEQIMNTILGKDMAGLRPEPEFAETMVRRFRQRTEARRSRAWEWLALLGRVAWGRPAQVVYAMLMLVAMVRTGSVITGEPFPLAAGTEAVRLRLLGANTYVGRTAVNAGTLTFGGALDDLQKQESDEAVKKVSGIRALAAPMAAPVEAPADTQPALEANPRTLNAPKEYDLGNTQIAQLRQSQGQKMVEQVPMDEKARQGTPNYVGRSSTTLAGGTLATSGNGNLGWQSSSDSTAPSPVDQRKLIRNASVQYEVADFQRATDSLAVLLSGEQGFVATQNSDRGANGKMEGTVVVKVPPDHLDSFLIKLRTLGSLKNQTLTTDDVTKDYYDTDARMRDAQEEETRLLEILDKKTGKLAEVLEVERELARVRSSIEEMQGTLKYYNTMISYATVTIALAEKDVNAPAAFLLKRQDDLSVFAADVDAAFVRAKSIATSAKAQITDSNLQRDPNGNATATLNLLIDPDTADTAVSQLKALGRIENYNSTTQRVAKDGSGVSDTALTDRDKVEARITIRQDVEEAVQQTGINVQTQDVEAKLTQLKKAAADLGAQVKGASFQRDPGGQETGVVELRMPLRAYPGVLTAVENLGDVKNLSVHRQEGATVTDTAPAEMTVQLNTQPRIITPENGVWASVRRTLSEAFGAVMWSARMIGVSLAFIAPWLIALGVVIGGVKLARRLRRKGE